MSTYLKYATLSFAYIPHCTTLVCFQDFNVTVYVVIKIRGLQLNTQAVSLDPKAFTGNKDTTC